MTEQADAEDLGRELDELGLTEAELDAALEADHPVDLAAVWAPDDGMVGRVTNRVEQRIANREAAAALVDLIGLGWFTLKAMFDDDNEA